MLDSMLSALGTLTDPVVVLTLLIGVVVGWIFGTLPGLSAIIGLTVAMPFTFGWEPVRAMYLFIGIIGACTFSGSVTAILLNTPGTPLNAATTFDGFPMTKKGQGGKAIGISAMASGMGALFGVVVLIALMPVMRVVVLSFGPPEFFWLVMLGLATVAFSSRGNMLRGLVAGGIGMLISMVGYSYVHTNTLRFTFHSMYLWEGLELVPFVVGLLAVSALIDYTVKGGTISKEKVPSKLSGVWEGAKEVFKHKLCFFRSAAIGTAIGIIPGIGASTSCFVSYSIAMQTSKHPETFGTGDPEGVLAPESGNNATDGGALVPTLAFGIPGSPIMAVLLGAFIFHGVIPGPLLLRDNLEIVWALIIGLVLANVLTSTMGIFAAPYLARISQIKVTFLAPIVLILCVAGAYVVAENFWDVALTLAAGVFGYLMNRFGFPVICLVMGFLLGVLAEQNYFSALQMNWGDPIIFFRPIALIIFVLFILVVSIPFITIYRAFIRRKRESLT